MMQNTLLLLLLAGLSQVSIAKPTTGHGDNNVITDSVLEYRAQYAARMLSYMNLSVEPCDDFYEYACGNWPNTIQERVTDEGRLHFLDLNFQLGDIVEKYLQRPDINDVAPEYAYEFDLAKKFHLDCLASDSKTMRKSNEYLKVLKDIGGFPAVEPNWNAKEFSWFNMSAHLNNYGAESLINEDIVSQYPYTPEFPLPAFGIGMELHDDTIRNVSSNAYQMNKDTMQQILTVYEVSEDKSMKIIADVFDFLGDVLSLMKTFDESQAQCDLMSQTLDSSINNTSVMEEFGPYFEIAWMGKFTDLESGYTTCVYFFHELKKVCDKHREAVANYLSMKFLYDMDDHYKDVANFRRDYCLEEIKLTFSSLFDHLYMKLNFNQNIVEDVTAMYDLLRASMVSVLENTDLFDEPSRAAALLKASVIKLSVGRYEDPVAHAALLAQLKTLQFVEGNYEANKMNLKKFNVYIQRYFGLNEELFDVNTKPLPILKAMTANAFFFLLDNTMYIAAGVLQPPVYDKDWPMSLKLGTLGVTVGHELGHSYDPTGSKFDHTGSNNEWWTEDVATNFGQLAECFVQHYNNYTVDEIKRNINGQLTLDENIADYSGLLTGYMTYRRYIDDRTYESDEAYRKDQGLPGLDVSPDQLFFLGNAQLWCSKYKEAEYWKQLADNHSIAKYRVLGMAANSKDFAKAFNCKVGDNMNAAQDKCHMW